MYLATGGGAGIGRAVAQHLSAQGRQAVICGRRHEPLLSVQDSCGDGVLAVPADCGNPADVRRLVDALDALDGHDGLDGRVRGSVHCAGGNPAIGRPEPTSLEQVADLFEGTMRGNVRSIALLAAALRDRWADGASVVLVGSIAAEHGVGQYGPAKAAVASYAVGLAHELGPCGVRVNCLAPGYVAGTEFFPAGLSEQRAGALREQTALGRTGEVQDAVAVIDFLLSDAARHVTGQTIHLDGGAHTTR